MRHHMRLRCDVELEIPAAAPDESEPLRERAHVAPAMAWARQTRKVKLVSGGDAAAAHAGWAIDSPVCRHGVCFRCLLPKSMWADLEKCKTAPRRNLVYQWVANHRNPFPYLAKIAAANGKAELAAELAARPPPRCPHCGVTVDEALETTEDAEYAAASETRRLEIRRVHSKRHAGGLRGLRPILPMDHRTRARSALHRRMNACGNNIAATFMKVPFDLRCRG
mmetsp:Transcript_43328/g.114597  ORF Transcript_43328/g.114597 Transcript_43328/m.114597 type:complete len:223 (-) Transcript_43328:38-706(-)